MYRGKQTVREIARKVRVSIEKLCKGLKCQPGDLLDDDKP
jgi:DNA-binding Xre family transcriptional regulator